MLEHSGCEGHTSLATDLRCGAPSLLVHGLKSKLAEGSVQAVVGSHIINP